MDCKHCQGDNLCANCLAEEEFRKLNKVFCYHTEEKDEMLCPDCGSAEEFEKLNSDETKNVLLKAFAQVEGKERCVARVFSDCVKFFNKDGEEIAKKDLEKRVVYRILRFRKERELLIETKGYLLLKVPFEFPRKRGMSERSLIFELNKASGQFITMTTNMDCRYAQQTLFEEDLVLWGRHGLFLDLNTNDLFQCPTGYSFEDIKAFSSECGIILMKDNSAFSISREARLTLCSH